MDTAARADLIDALRRTAERLVALLAGLTEAQLTLKPSPGAFSIRENVHHLRDIEVEGHAVRLERLLREDGPTLPGIDGDRLARERRYNETPHEGALDELRRARLASVSRLERLAPEEWLRAGELQTVGRVTVERLVEIWSEHDRSHLEEVESLVGRS